MADWQVATVEAVAQQGRRAKSFVLRLPDPVAHKPGQHYDLRLTAPDGYQAQRSYSVASPPLDLPRIELLVDRYDEGEVTPYLHEVVEAGDELEVRGPFTQWFTWDGATPATLVGGGSGVAPLVAMLRQRRRTAPEVPMRLLASFRTAADVPWADELAGDGVVWTLTREGDRRRVDRELVQEVLQPGGTTYVCGSHPFVEHVTDLLAQLGVAADTIRTERFGPS